MHMCGHVPRTWRQYFVIGTLYLRWDLSYKRGGLLARAISPSPIHAVVFAISLSADLYRDTIAIHPPMYTVLSTSFSSISQAKTIFYSTPLYTVSCHVGQSHNLSSCPCASKSQIRVRSTPLLYNHVINQPPSRPILHLQPKHHHDHHDDHH